jgi:uncharacterized peroxidase-related enzyme
MVPVKPWKAWLEYVPYEEAEGKLKTLYDRIRDPQGNIDNIMLAHSLRPHSMEGHMALYKNVLHHSANTLPKWLLEAVGVYVSQLNRCEYCVEHHYVGMKRLLKDDGRSGQIRRALEADQPQQAFAGGELAIMGYTRRLTLEPSSVDGDDVQALRAAGLDDGQILEVNQVVAYFAYANRTVLGLGVSTDGDVLGTSPGSGDSDDWTHR